MFAVYAGSQERIRLPTRFIGLGSKFLTESLCMKRVKVKTADGRTRYFLIRSGRPF